MAEQLNEENFQSFLDAAQLPVLADFYRDGCIPCRRITPVLTRLEEEYGERLLFVRVNCAANTELAQRYTVEAAPTLILFQRGAEVGRCRGSVDRAALLELIESHL